MVAKRVRTWCLDVRIAGMKPHRVVNFPTWQESVGHEPFLKKRYIVILLFIIIIVQR